jgi:hypothetical protein
MGARETSLNTATLVFKYWFGLFFCGFSLLLFNRQHPYGTGLVCLGFIALGVFFLSVTRVRLEGNEVMYRRWIRWRALPYSEIRECGESWVYGYIKTRRFVLPWGRIYFVRPKSSDSLFGLDREIISTIRFKANI